MEHINRIINAYHKHSRKIRYVSALIALIVYAAFFFSIPAVIGLVIHIWPKKETVTAEDLCKLIEQRLKLQEQNRHKKPTKSKNN
jgi:hypothetical protein